MLQELQSGNAFVEIMLIDYVMFASLYKGSWLGYVQDVLVLLSDFVMCMQKNSRQRDAVLGCHDVVLFCSVSVR